MKPRSFAAVFAALAFGLAALPARPAPVLRAGSPLRGEPQRAARGGTTSAMFGSALAASSGSAPIGSTVAASGAAAASAGAAARTFSRSSATAAATSLTGEWDGDDGGYFYLTQVGDTLYGYGESKTQVEIPMYADPDTTEPAWAAVLVGRIAGGCVRGTWARVPRGREAGGHGRFTLSVYAGGNLLRVVREAGGFGPRRLIRIAYIDRGNWANRKLPEPPTHACDNAPAALQATFRHRGNDQIAHKDGK